MAGEERRLLARAFALLPEADRDVLELRVLAGLGAEQVGALTGRRAGRRAAGAVAGPRPAAHRVRGADGVNDDRAGRRRAVERAGQSLGTRPRRDPAARAGGPRCARRPPRCSDPPSSRRRALLTGGIAAGVGGLAGYLGPDDLRTEEPVAQPAVPMEAITFTGEAEVSTSALDQPHLGHRARHRPGRPRAGRGLRRRVPDPGRGRRRRLPARGGRRGHEVPLQRRPAARRRPGHRGALAGRRRSSCAPTCRWSRTGRPDDDDAMTPTWPPSRPSGTGSAPRTCAPPASARRRPPAGCTTPR